MPVKELLKPKRHPDNRRRQNGRPDQVFGVRERVGMRVEDVRVEDRPWRVREGMHVPADGPEEEPRIDAAAQEMVGRAQRERPREDQRERGVRRQGGGGGDRGPGDLVIW